MFCFHKAITNNTPKTARKQRRRNSKTQQMLESKKGTRETKTIQSEATEVLRAEHMDFTTGQVSRTGMSCWLAAFTKCHHSSLGGGTRFNAAQKNWLWESKSEQLVLTKMVVEVTSREQPGSMNIANMTDLHGSSATGTNYRRSLSYASPVPIQLMLNSTKNVLLTLEIQLGLILRRYFMYYPQ